MLVEIDLLEKQTQEMDQTTENRLKEQEEFIARTKSRPWTVTAFPVDGY